jgi:biopolymer transport protein ExbD
MQFSTRRRGHPPTVIIVSLIDVLIVVLIFLMVTTTFKKQPALKLTLPESNQPKTGAADNLNMIIVSIDTKGVLYFGSNKDPVTLATLQRNLKTAVQANPDVTLSIRADTAAPWGQVVAVRDAARDAKIKNVSGQVSEKAPSR